MNACAKTVVIQTKGKGTYEITHEIERIVRESGVTTGTATVFLQHTSASLVIYENADPSARTDLHRFFERLVPEDSADYVHTAEGPDDSTSHLRMVLTRSSETVPVINGRPRARDVAGHLRFRAPPGTTQTHGRRLGGWYLSLQAEC